MSLQNTQTASSSNLNRYESLQSKLKNKVKHLLIHSYSEGNNPQIICLDLTVRLLEEVSRAQLVVVAL